MNPHRTGCRRPAAQRGVVIVVVLIFLVLLALLGLDSMQANVLQEKEAGNARDVNIAFQAAEAALRTGELYVVNTVTEATPFSATCAGGRCVPSTTGTPVWTDPGLAVWATAANHSTMAANINGVAAQPVYIIELMGEVPPGTGDSMAIGFASRLKPNAYRITALGYGGTSTTQVMLQSIYIKH